LWLIGVRSLRIRISSVWAAIDHDFFFVSAATANDGVIVGIVGESTDATIAGPGYAGSQCRQSYGISESAVYLQGQVLHGLVIHHLTVGDGLGY
jgi:hypothetical protein